MVSTSSIFISINCGGGSRAEGTAYVDTNGEIISEWKTIEIN